MINLDKKLDDTMREYVQITYDLYISLVAEQLYERCFDEEHDCNELNSGFHEVMKEVNEARTNEEAYEILERHAEYAAICIIEEFEDRPV